jgi:signal transduction histidine kinase
VTTRARFARRLYVRIYLTLLAALLVVVGLSAALWRFTTQRADENDHARLLGALAAQALPRGASAAALDAALARLAVPPIHGLALLDRDDRVLARAGGLLDSDAQHLSERAHHPHPLAGWRALPLDDGRTLLLWEPGTAWRIHHDGLVLIALIAALVALVTYPVVRRLTQRLEALAASVERFGQGELAARAAVTGQDEVADLSARFNAMADRVAGLLEAHGRLLANASHELRSPLARVRLALELHATAPRPELLDGMRRDCAELEAQIEEILLSSRLEAVQGPAEDTALDLAALVAEESARLEVPFEVEPAELHGDPRLLRKLVRNLIENAQRHGGRDVGTTVHVAANGARVLRVSDRGPGIAQAERERIFEPFYRPANRGETGTGWGLGLALVRQIAAHHGGHVQCLPRDGGGCVFEVVLPARQAE